MEQMVTMAPYRSNLSRRQLKEAAGSLVRMFDTYDKINPKDCQV